MLRHENAVLRRQPAILRPVATAQQDDQAEYPARQQLDDLEQHPPAKYHRVQPAGDSAGQLEPSVSADRTISPGTLLLEAAK